MKLTDAVSDAANRQTLWSKAITPWFKRDHQFWLAADSLRRTDEYLITKEASQRRALATLNRETFECHQHLCDFSALWVLAAYEIVRVLDERFNQNSAQPRVPRVRDAKRQFERVRMPIAKLERAERASLSTDTGRAWPRFHPEHGVHWLLGQQTVSRWNLSIALLEALLAIPSDESTAT